MLHPLFRSAASLVVALILIAGAAMQARARTPGATREEHIRRLKLLEQRVLMHEPAHRVKESKERARAQHTSRTRKPGAAQRNRPARDAGEWGLQAIPERVSAFRIGRRLEASVTANVRANDPALEPVGSAQSEVSIAALGNRVVAAWNDGQGIYDGSSTQGYGYSTDGGLTWVDGGIPPTSLIGSWSSDPVVVVNEKTGAFYYCGLCDPSANTNGIGVVKGTFVGNTLVWETPKLVAIYNNSSNLLDKQWLAVDSLTGNLYLTYSNFTVFGGQLTSNKIEFLGSTDDNQSWTSPTTLSSPIDAGYVQGSRPAVGPNGEVYTVWWAIGQASNSPDGKDFMRTRKSITQGASFLPEVTADGLFSNWGSGAPGFNRGLGVSFPSIAVDRTNGPRRGRVYLAWNESIDFYNDNLGTGTSRNEVEPNNSAAQATSFTPGQVLRGVIATPGNPGDHDYFRFSGTQGQTVVFYLDSLNANLDAAFRIFCTDGVTRLGFSQTGVGTGSLLVFTLPTTGTYSVRVASYQGGAIGGYSIQTAFHAPVGSDRARDHRDIFVKSSDNGIAWGPTVRANDDAGYYDDWLPEVAVGRDSKACVAYYDWRDAASACGGASSVYFVRSGDGGATWGASWGISDAQSSWSTNYSTLIPNQGDYLTLFASDTTAYVGWGDGRDADPNVYTTSVNLNCSSAQVTAVGTQVVGDTATVTWNLTGGTGAVVTILRQTQGSSTFTSLGLDTADAGGQIVFSDATVVPGQSYVYRLGLQGYCQAFVGNIGVSIPSVTVPGIALLGVRPNPTPHDVFVSFALISTEPASLELLDITGRRIHRRDLASPAPGVQVVNLTEGIQPVAGVYVVRLTQSGQTATTRVTIRP